MIDKRIFGALIGLAGAVNNNGKTENTDEVVRRVLRMMDVDEAIRCIHREKYAISPNCETCQSPCGNTSDYDASRFANDPEPIASLKEQIMEAMIRIAKCDPLPDIIYKAISYLGYEMTEKSYTELLEDMKACSERLY